MSGQDTLSLVEASIKDLKQALDSGALTSVELVSLYLHRIGKYDTRGPSLNSICILNQHAFEEAQASDDRRAAGLPPRPLEGIPFTVKDSFSVKGMTVAAGSPAFANLVASSDAAIVQLLRSAGALVLGRTNMPAMADGGSQRGLYGRAESPYNPTYSTTAYASGSSNGSGTATASSLASFGLAGETVSSGRSPASNNALVGYAPSRGLVPTRGQWPLYPTCDCVVPHARSVADLLAVLAVVVADDPAPAAPGPDFWRHQPFVSIPPVSAVRPRDFGALQDPDALRGKRVAVPRCFVGVEGAEPATVCSPAVRALWEQARADIEALGASVVETGFPLFEQYTAKDFPGQSANVPGMTEEWVGVERCQMIALAWDDFLRANGDEAINTLTAVSDPDTIKPLVAPMDDPKMHTEAQNQVRYSEMLEAVRTRGEATLTTLPGAEGALRALEAMRKRALEDWMDANGLDLLVFPTQGDVALADADERRESMLLALRDGVKYANGGRALKHLGVPCVTVPMGEMEDTGMPVGLTFCARAWDDARMLSCAYAYENGSRRRTRPPLTPPLLQSDCVKLVQRSMAGTQKPELTVKETNWSQEEDTESEVVRSVFAAGTVKLSDPEARIEDISVFVNGERAEGLTVKGDSWTWRARVARPKRNERFPTIAVVPKDQFMAVIVAKASNGRCAATLILGD